MGNYFLYKHEKNKNRILFYTFFSLFIDCSISRLRQYRFPLSNPFHFQFLLCHFLLFSLFPLLCSIICLVQTSSCCFITAGDVAVRLLQVSHEASVRRGLQKFHLRDRLAMLELGQPARPNHTVPHNSRNTRTHTHSF